MPPTYCLPEIIQWLKPPYNIDGWRFDVADVFARNDAGKIIVVDNEEA